MSYIISVDTGGTFTDVVVMGKDRHLWRAKAPSTPRNFSDGLMEALTVVSAEIGISVRDLLENSSLFSHGCTVTTNALINRNGAKTGLLTTKGHEDAILIGRVQQKVAGLSEDEMRDLLLCRKAIPIVPRTLIKGITERIDSKGRVVVPIDEDSVKKAVVGLVEVGVKAIAVCFLWSFINPAHEKVAKGIINQSYPDLLVSLSSELVPLIKEYERVATTALNAYLGPVFAKYILELQDRLKNTGFKGSFAIMNCSGGIMSTDEAARKAVFTLSSGPVGGIMASRQLGKRLGYENIITSDVGGTSFDVGLIVRGEPQFAQAPVVDKYHVLLPMIDVVSIGAGTGSIAQVEGKTGRLTVGPRSAGGDPGPSCYGKGGCEPTVGDANLILGRLNPEYFWGGRMRLNKDLAFSVVETKIAQPLNIAVPEAAMAIVDIVDAHMADLIRKMTVGRGYDPRDFVLFSFGGAGPLHVGSYAKDVGVKKVVIPETAAVFSAFGILSSDFLTVRELSEPTLLPVELTRIENKFQRLEKDVLAILSKSGFENRDVELLRFLEMKYKGQIHTIFCPVTGLNLEDIDSKALMDTFEKTYEETYGAGTAYRGAGMELSTYRVIGLGKITKPSILEHLEERHTVAPSVKETRPVYFRRFGGFWNCPIYAYEKLTPGSSINGPAIVESADTTVVVHPEQQVKVDKFLNLILEVN